MTDFESFLILVGSVVVALVAIGLWLLWDADADPTPDPTAELERTAVRENFGDTAWECQVCYCLTLNPEEHRKKCDWSEDD